MKTRLKTTGADIFGKLKFNKSVQALLDETDKNFEKLNRVEFVKEKK